MILAEGIGGKGGGVEPNGSMSLVFFQYFTVYLNSVCRTGVCEGWYLPRLPDNAYLWPGWGSPTTTEPTPLSEPVR
jgi:hypothetical protein